MSFTIQCQSCGQVMSAEPAWVGQQIQCVRCNAQVLVQTGGTPAAPETPATPASQPTAEAAPAQAPAASPAAPAVQGRPQKGSPRRTFVADWAQGMAEQWAEDHQDDIASERKPSGALLIVGSLLTVLLGLYILAAAAMAMLAYFGAGALGAKSVSVTLLVVGIVMAVGGLVTLVAGALSFGARMGWVGASIGLAILWALLSLIGMLNAGVGAPMMFKIVAGGIVVFCCLTAAFAALGRKQAYNINVWKERQARLARGG